MSSQRFSKRTGKAFRPETLMMGLGYDPFLSEGAVKPPVFLTSTFAFRNSAEGKLFFEWAYGLKERDPDQDPEMGLIYSRLNNPDLEILEERLAAWEEAESALVFSSGMAAITTTVMSLVRPGQMIISSNPVYGGTDFFFEHLCPGQNIEVLRTNTGSSTVANVEAMLKEHGDKIRMIYMETPSNPTNQMVDLKALVELVNRYKEGREEGNELLLVVDNTFLGPLFQQPVKLGVDISVYSATKFIGGHSDLVAGAVMGSGKLLKSVAVHRTILGSMAEPFTCWLMLRSLETLSIRMQRQQKNALKLVEILKEHPVVERIFYPGELDDEQTRIWEEQCVGSGSLISFTVKGGEEEAFKVLDSFELAKLAVSLGGTETLVEHPGCMTHSDLDEETKAQAEITPNLIRISTGIEHADDLMDDLRGALDQIR